VVVEHRIPAGGEDRGGTAWSRVVPLWFGRWCARRDHVPHQPVDIARSTSALAGDPAERLTREAAFLLVFGSRPAIKDALLGRLS